MLRAMTGVARIAFGLWLLVAWGGPAAAGPDFWRHHWATDFTKTAVPWTDIVEGGPGKDGIPPIDDPVFVPVDAVALDDREPVIGLVLDGVARAYPLRILTWHEIVNDTVAGRPLAITFCPLCNAAIVFDRTVDGRVLDFGTTGKLRHSDLIMWDRQTESWWQQFTGRAIVGAMLGERLAIVPSRLESWADFKARAPDGQVLVPNDPGARPYGANPYAGYDSGLPFLYRGEVPDGVRPLARVVALADRDRAWALDYLRARGRVVAPDGTVITWTPGQASALDTAEIAAGRDVGSVLAQRDGRDVAYFVDFAFAFHAFHPDAPIVTGE